MFTKPARKNKCEAETYVGFEFALFYKEAIAHENYAADKRGKERDDSDSTDQSCLLGPYRKDEVGMCLWQVKQLLNAVTQANTKPLAATVGNQRLD